MFQLILFFLTFDVCFHLNKDQLLSSLLEEWLKAFEECTFEKPSVNVKKQHCTGSFTSLASTRRPVKTVLKAARKPGLITKNCGLLSWCSCQYFFLFIYFFKHTSLRCNTLMCHARRNWVKAWSYLNPMAIVSCGDEISISSLILLFEQPRKSSVSFSPWTYFASSARTMTSNFTKGRFQRGRFFCTTIVRGCTL